MSFSLIGIFMTLTTLSISVYLLKVKQTPLIPTYVTVYGISIFVSYLLNSYFTFKSKVKMDRTLIYFAVYLSSMALGVVLLTIYKSTLPFENWVFPFFVLPFTVSNNFYWSNKYLKNDAG